MNSEFGKGLVYNLVLFAMHCDNEFASEIRGLNFVIHMKDVTEYDRTIFDALNTIEAYKDIYPNPADLLRHRINMWANGASDHLYEIKTNVGDKELKKKLEELKTLGLDMGHGSGLIDGTVCNWDNFCKLHELVKECARLIDSELLKIPTIKADWE